ncbi:acyl-CoA transferase|nr:hypothetical protein [Candidatus Pantoea persica]MBA2814530.1 acyl-CoA transferase [Candidatus Pantoea persica]
MALDHATGYLMAAALEGLRQCHISGYGVQARTALLLQQHPSAAESAAAGITAHRHDALPPVEITPWGVGERLPGTPQLCATAGCELGTHPARW